MFRFKPEWAVKILFFAFIGQGILSVYQFWVENYVFMAFHIFFTGWLYYRWKQLRDKLRPDKTWRSYDYRK